MSYQLLSNTSMAILFSLHLLVFSIYGHHLKVSLKFMRYQPLFGRICYVGEHRIENGVTSTASVQQCMTMCRYEENQCRSFFYHPPTGQCALCTVVYGSSNTTLRLDGTEYFRPETGVSMRTDCPQDWTAFQDSCYLFWNVGMIFEDAKSFCSQRYGSYLVHVDSSDENSFIKNFLNSSSGKDSWMGLTMNTEGDFVWNNTGVDMTFSDWGPGQPDNYLGLENCSDFHRGSGWRWNDAFCNTAHRPICEIWW